MYLCLYVATTTAASTGRLPSSDK